MPSDPESSAGAMGRGLSAGYVPGVCCTSTLHAHQRHRPLERMEWFGLLHTSEQQRYSRTPLLSLFMSNVTFLITPDLLILALMGNGPHHHTHHTTNTKVKGGMWCNCRSPPSAPERGPDFWRVLQDDPYRNQTNVTLLFEVHELKYKHLQD